MFAFWTEKRYFFQDGGKNLSKTYFFRFFSTFFRLLPNQIDFFLPFSQPNGVFFREQLGHIFSKEILQRHFFSYAMGSTWC